MPLPIPKNILSVMLETSWLGQDLLNHGSEQITEDVKTKSQVTQCKVNTQSVAGHFRFKYIYVKSIVVSVLELHGTKKKTPRKKGTRFLIVFVQYSEIQFASYLIQL